MMKLLLFIRKEYVKKYEPRKEKVQRVQTQLLALSRAVTMCG